MYGVPGSHKNSTNYFMKLGKDANGKSKTFYEPSEKPTYDIKNNVPLEAEKGSVVLLHGDFVHYSYENKSPNQRHAYTIHLVESRNHTWEADNWLQRKDVPFKFLYDTEIREKIKI
jgi:phytanoyl-CoA hydroxylase